MIKKIICYIVTVQILLFSGLAHAGKLTRIDNHYFDVSTIIRLHVGDPHYGGVRWVTLMLRDGSVISVLMYDDEIAHLVATLNKNR